MNEYEMIVESVTPCGGEHYAQKEIVEIEAESPEAYVREHGRLPVREIIRQPNGNVKIITGDEKGYIVRYSFSS